MITEFIAFAAVAVYLLAGIFVLFLGGWLVQHDRNRDATGFTARLINDLRWVEDLAVDFFARTRPSTELLSVLTTRQAPVPANELTQKINADTQSLSEEWGALGIMRLGGLVRFTRDGVIATDVGREIYQRISNPPLSPGENEFRPRSIYDSLFVPIPVDTDASSHVERVSEAFQRRAPEVIQQNRVAALTGIGQLRVASRGMNSSPKPPNTSSMENTSMKKRTIIITGADHEELNYAIRAAGKLSERGRVEMSSLAAELERAEIVDAGEIPPDVITMNSRAELLDLSTGERMEFTLVFPIDADIEASKISVLAPLGTAMLGYRVGDDFEWIVPYGLRRLRVMAVRFQPEASLAMAA